jgi:hypothetical protein
MEFKNLLEIVQDEPVFDTGLLLVGDVNSREIRRQLSASYVSLQSALAYYGMIPEHVPVTTSVSTSRPARWETTLGIYDFRHIQIPFFDGFRVVDLGEQQQAFIAIPEKSPAGLDLPGAGRGYARLSRRIKTKQFGHVGLADSRAPCQEDSETQAAARCRNHPGIGRGRRGL